MYKRFLTNNFFDPNDETIDWNIVKKFIDNYDKNPSFFNDFLIRNGEYLNENVLLTFLKIISIGIYLR